MPDDLLSTLFPAQPAPLPKSVRRVTFPGMYQGSGLHEPVTVRMEKQRQRSLAYGRAKRAAHRNQKRGI